MRQRSAGAAAEPSAGRVVAHRGRRRRRAGFWYRLAAVILRPPFLALTRRDWRGAEHLPTTQGYIVCVNHISHVDPLTFAHFLYDNGHLPRFLAKDSLFRAPVVGTVIKGAEQIPVYRETNAVQAYSAAVDAVERGECVAIYPEATLTRDPDLWPMRGKTGAARVALATGRPVIPVAQWGAHRILPPYGRVPRLWRRHTSHVWAGPPVDLSRFAGQQPTVDVLQQATDAIIDAITELLAQIRQETPREVRWDPRTGDAPRFGNPNRRSRKGRAVR